MLTFCLFFVCIRLHGRFKEFQPMKLYQYVIGIMPFTFLPWQAFLRWKTRCDLRPKTGKATKAPEHIRFANGMMMPCSFLYIARSLSEENNCDYPCWYSSPTLYEMKIEAIIHLYLIHDMATQSSNLTTDTDLLMNHILLIWDCPLLYFRDPHRNIMEYQFIKKRGHCLPISKSGSATRVHPSK